MNSNGNLELLEKYPRTITLETFWKVQRPVYSKEYQKDVLHTSNYFIGCGDPIAGTWLTAKFAD